MPSQMYLYRSRYPALCVSIKEQRLNDGRVRIIATAVCAEDETEYPDIPQYTTKPVSKKRINSAIAEAIDVIASRYYEKYGGGELTQEAINMAFQAVEEKVHNGMYLKPGWDSASTNRNVLRFFRRNTLPLLSQKLVPGRMFLEEDRAELQAEMTRICARHGSENELASQENANKHLAEAEIVLAHMRDYDSRIPDVRLTSPDFSSRAYRSEQIKMLPLPVLLLFYKTLHTWVEKAPKIVFFAILVVLGCRPAEAAGTKPSDIAWYDDYCGVRIEHQEIKGALSTKLKNKYSKRRLIIPYWGRQLLQRCCELIGDDYPVDNRTMNNAIECAAWIKQLLIDCGATEAQLEEIGSEISDEDMDDDSVYDSKRAEETIRNQKKKLGCYVLRRCAATIMRVYMGLTLYETDRLLGHIPHGSGQNTASKLAHPDLNAPETQRRIAAKMERYIFDPAYTRNPKYSPITTDGQDSISLISGYPEVFIENAEGADLMLEIDLSATEAGDPLSIILPEQDSSVLYSSSVPINYEAVNRAVFVDMPEQIEGAQT